MRSAPSRSTAAVRSLALIALIALAAVAIGAAGTGGSASATPSPPPQHVSPPRAEEGLRDRARRFRVDHGLGASPALIERSLTDPAYAPGLETLWAVPLNRVELRRLDRHARFQESAGDIVAAAERDPAFAGAWHADGALSRIVLAFTDHRAPREARLRRLAAARGGVAVFEVRRFTFSHLDRVMRRIQGRWSSLERELRTDLTLLDAEEVRNRVEVGVARPSPALERQLRARFGPAVTVVPYEARAVFRRSP